MRHWIGSLTCVVALSACTPGARQIGEATLPSPVPTERHPLAGFWKDHCEDEVGLSIAPADGDLYSVSFCGPGGCFEPGTYRPNTRIVGDPAYKIVGHDALDVTGHDGAFQRYQRCKVESKPGA